MGGIEPLTFKIRKVVVPPELIVSNIYILDQYSFRNTK